MKNINKSATYLLLRSKDTLINLFVIGILSIICIIVFSMGFLDYKSVSEKILILYVLVLGTTIIVSNSMIIELSVKDKLSNRLEFFLASGINFKDLILSYSVQMLRISSVIPFILFVLGYYFLDSKNNFIFMIFIYLTTVSFAFAEILLLNIFSFTAKKFKLFKNVVIFGTFFLIYVLGMFSTKIVTIINKIGLDVELVIILMNIVFTLIIVALSIVNLKPLDNENLAIQKGEWL